MSSETNIWLSRYWYRKEFGLTSAEMDEEPLSEVETFMLIHRLEEKRQKSDNKKQERSLKGNKTT